MTDTAEIGAMSVEDALAHYGKKGMKWGVRNAPKPSSKEIIDARRRHADRGRDVRRAKRDIRKAGPKGSAERSAAKSKYATMKASRLNNPDHATAIRMTKGEEILSILFFTPVGAATVIGGRSVSRKMVESNQRKGVYNA